MQKISAIQLAMLILSKTKSDDDFIEYTSKLKLLKLLYYVQGYHLAAFGSPIFDDKMEAWLHGPVVPSVYKWCKGFKTDEDLANQALKKDEISTLELHPMQLSLIDDVLRVYNKYSAYGLRDKTHTELPWLAVYEKDSNNEITNNSLREFFEPLYEK